jgi:hypothetical protein
MRGAAEFEVVLIKIWLLWSLSLYRGDDQAGAYLGHRKARLCERGRAYVETDPAGAHREYAVTTRLAPRQNAKLAF